MLCIDPSQRLTAEQVLGKLDTHRVIVCLLVVA